MNLQRNSDQAAYEKAYDEAYQAAYDEAWAEILAEIDEKYADAEEKYELDDASFQPVPASVYENFFRNETEDNDSDGVIDGTVRVYKRNEDVNLACLLDGRFRKTGMKSRLTECMQIMQAWRREISLR